MRENLTIFSNLMTSGLHRHIKWVKGGNHECIFDPEKKIIQIPFIDKDIDDTTQRGWVFLNICQAHEQYPEFWKRAKREGIGEKAFSFVNQIWGCRQIRKLYPGSGHDIFELLRREFKFLRLNDIFSLLFHLEHFPSQSISLTAEEEKLYGLMKNMETEDDFIDLCIELQKSVDCDDSSNDQNILTQIAGLIGGDQSNEDEGEGESEIHIKRFNPVRYWDACQPCFVSSRESLRLNQNEPHVVQQIDDLAIDSFLKKIQSQIDNLLEQFEILKSAKTDNTKSSDEGDIDTDQLFKHQFAEDIWEEVVQVKEGKNHGVLCAVDFSSSMVGYKLRICLEQLLVLEGFCHQANLPHKILAFADGAPKSTIDPEPDEYITPYPAFKLYMLFDSELTDDERKLMRRFLGLLWATSRGENRVVTGFSLSKTPWYNTMCAIPGLVHHFFQEHQIEKLCLLTQTDGLSFPLSYSDDDEIVEHSSVASDTIRIFDEGTNVFYEENTKSLAKMIDNHTPGVSKGTLVFGSKSIEWEGTPFEAVLLDGNFVKSQTASDATNSFMDRASYESKSRAFVDMFMKFFF